MKFASQYGTVLRKISKHHQFYNKCQITKKDNSLNCQILNNVLINFAETISEMWEEYRF